ncbi:hypothetical protein SDC9_169826 [bioreactor metagenome]|uniref:Uncharacterized protein n=1 Tax=bioreactor metagenome TaxID=1076179 RepID=A0A645GF87_9ZZZZ
MASTLLGQAIVVYRTGSATPSIIRVFSKLDVSTGYVEIFSLLLLLHEQINNKKASIHKITYLSTIVFCRLWSQMYDLLFYLRKLSRFN